MSIFGSMSGRSTSKFNKIITYLQQKLVDAETQGKQIFDAGDDNLPENIDSFDIEQARDLGIRTTLKTTGNIYRMVEGPDNKNLRCHVKFTNAAKLYDYSRNGLTSYVYGLGQIPILSMKKVPQNVLGYEFQSFFNGSDQYAYTEDHEKIRISEMFDDDDVSHISFYDSCSPIGILHKNNVENSVLFEKIDDDQLKDGFAATMNNKGDLFFYVRRDFKQYSLFLKGIYTDQVNDELTNGGNYLATNYSDISYVTDLEYTTNLLCSIVKTDDHWFVYDKSDNGIKYILNGVDLTQSYEATPILDVPFQDGSWNEDGSDRTTVNDISAGSYDGTITNPTNGQWQTNNTFFSFGSNTAGDGGGCEVNFPTIATLDSATAYTVSFMFKPDSIINTKSYSEWLVSKNYSSNGSFLVYRITGTANLQAIYRDNSGTFYFATLANAITSTDWHNITVKFEANQKISLSVNGVTALSSTTLPANVSTGGTLKIYRTASAIRGTICYLRVYNSILSANDTQRLIDEGYHNPTFPNAEKPQPVPVEDPDPITNPFEVFYNLAYDVATTGTVYLNAVEGDSAFVKGYDVAAGIDESFPEAIFYQVSDGDSSGTSDPFVEQYNLQSTDNSSVVCSNDQNDAGGVGVQTGSTLIGKKITRAIFYLRGVNSPTGSVYCRIWDASDNVVATLDYWNGSTLGTLNASSVASSYTAYEFRNTTFNWGSSSLQSGWTVGIEYATSDSNDEIDIRRTASNSKSNEIQHSRDVGTSDFNTNSSNDVAAILYSGGGTTANNPYTTISKTPYTSGEHHYYAFGEYFPSGSPALGKTPTRMEFKAYRHASASGTLTLGHYGPDTTLKATLATYTVTDLPTTAPGTYNITWTNRDYPNPIASGDRILLVLTSSNSNPVYILTNRGATAAPTSYDDTRTCVTFRETGFGGFVPEKWVQNTADDISGNMYIGGNEFVAHETYSSSKTRVYIKGISSLSSAIGKKLTKATVQLRKVGSPTGLMTCNVRINGSDAVRFSLGTFDVSSLSTSFSDATFTNVFNSLTTANNDRISFEYLGANSTNYVEIAINKDVLETTNTIGGTYSSPVFTDNAQIDIAGQLYTGGEPDVNSRTRCGQKIAVDNDSIMDGNKLTKIRVYLKNEDAVLGNVYCKVFRGSDDTPIVQIGDPVAASGIGATFEAVEFENVNNGYVLNVNDVVAIVFEGGDTTNRIGVGIREGFGYDGDNSYVVRYNGQVYDTITNSDLVATMWFGGDTYQPPPFAQPDPTPTNIKALLYCAGNNILSGFARVLQREFGIWAEDTTEEEALNKYENRYSKTSRSPQEVLVAGLYRPF